MFRFEKDMRGIVSDWLKEQGYLYAYEAFLLYGSADIVAGRFGSRVSNRRPPLIEGMTVELKLSDVQGVLRQGVCNRAHVDWSYAAMPSERISRMRAVTLGRFSLSGVGLLSVSPNRVDIIIKPERLGPTSGRVAKNLWRRSRRVYAEIEARNISP